MVPRPALFSRLMPLAGRIAGVALLAVSLAAADQPVRLPQFAYPDVLPALMAAAGQEGVNVLVREFPPTTRRAVPGDELTFVVSLQDGKELKQWVLNAKTGDLTEKEKQLPPLKPFHRYLSTGTELKFEGRRAAIEMVLIGPMKPGQGDEKLFKPHVKRRRLLVNADYLELGFSGACEGELDLRAVNEKRPKEKQFSSKMGTKPFPPAEVQATRALAAEVGVTPERERAFYGSTPALLEFFNLITKTPGLQDILKEVIDVSWWSLLANSGSTKMRLDYVNQHIAKLEDLRPGLPQYVFPLVIRVNDKPAMAVILVVTEPRAPFATSAGVLGLQAGRPYDNDPQLTVRIIGSRYPREAGSPGDGK